jgi:hypothetical protein
LGICLPAATRLLDVAAPFDPAIERREHAPFPAFESRRRFIVPLPRQRTILEFASRLERYFNDWIGLRRGMLECFAAARVAGVVPASVADAMGGEVPVGSRVTVIGTHGWLFFGGTPQATLVRNSCLYTEDELDKWQQWFDERRRWLDARGIKFAVLIPPVKHRVYPEFVPYPMHPVRLMSRYDQLLARLNESGAALAVDVLPALRQARHECDTYYQTDSHWNTFGAFVAYRELMRHLAQHSAVSRIADQDDFKFLPMPEFHGDQAILLQRPDWPESAALMVEPRVVVPTTHREESVPLGDGKYAKVRYCDNPTVQTGLALVIHDSFFGAMEPFFERHWNKTAYVSRYDDEFPAELIEQLRPDVVLLQMVEWRLMSKAANTPLPASTSVGHSMAEREDAAKRR